MNIGILGAGAWGSALADIMVHNGHKVMLWVHEQELERLPHVTMDMQAVVTQADLIIVAVPTTYIRSVMQQARIYCSADQRWVVASKGIEQDTGLFPTQIVTDVIPSIMHIGALSGPSFAHDVQCQQPTGIVIATTDAPLAVYVTTLFSNKYIRIEQSTDLIGVQLGGAVKNCLALAVGILQGAGYTDNARALLVTRGLQEIITIGAALGAHEATFYGLAGIGDLVLTTMSNKSRNITAGNLLAQGVAVDDLFAHMDAIAEGVNTLAALEQLTCTRGIHAPLHKALHAIVFRSVPLQSLIDLL